MQHWFMTTCPICAAPLRGGRDKGHVKQCEALEFGLLYEQVSPTVDEKPPGFDYSEWPKPGAFKGPWRG